MRVYCPKCTTDMVIRGSTHIGRREISVMWPQTFCPKCRRVYKMPPAAVSVMQAADLGTRVMHDPPFASQLAVLLGRADAFDMEHRVSDAVYDRYTSGVGLKRSMCDGTWSLADGALLFRMRGERKPVNLGNELLRWLACSMHREEFRITSEGVEVDFDPAALFGRIFPPKASQRSPNVILWAKKAKAGKALRALRDEKKLEGVVPIETYFD